eukprot:94583_1
MAAREPNNEVLRNVLTIILSVLAGIAVCAGIAGILYALGVVVVHMGECKDKAGTGSDASGTDPNTATTVIKPAPATVYRRPKVATEKSGRIYVMFAKVKKAGDGDDRYQKYDFTVIENGVSATAVKTSGLTGDLTIDVGPNVLSACTNGDKPNHHKMYVCIVVAHATIGAKFKFTYQPLLADGTPVKDKKSEVSGEVEGAATETNPFQQVVAGGKSDFITNIAVAASFGFVTAIILVAVMNFFKKKEPAKERLVAKYDATVV